jgi:membrane-bound metal-dependent hydrolase YbcI (DUF457 family)
MYPFGHLGFTLAFFHSSSSLRERINTYALAFGTLLPDIIDKSFGQFIFQHGRFVGHSIVIGFVTCFAAGILLKLLNKDDRIAVSLLCGWSAHLIEDSSGFLPWLYPLVQYNFPISTLDPLRALSNPYVLSCEIMGATLLGLLAYRYGYVDIVKEQGLGALFRVLLEDLK